MLAAAALAMPAAAECRLALAVGIDISSSVDPAEDVLQRQGLARALASDAVRAAAFSEPGASVAIAVFEWSGRDQQDLIVDWTLLETAGDLHAIAAAVAASRRSYAAFPTAIGFALGYASGLLQRAPACSAQTLDLSGDGPNNAGFPPDRAYAHFPLGEVTVNGLAIAESEPAVVPYYRREVLHGPGAFLEIAERFTDFEDAMRRKLEREMGARILGALQ